MYHGKTILKSVMVVLIILTPKISFSQNSQWSGNVNLLLGMKMLNKDDWFPSEVHVGTGLGFDIRRTNWPFDIYIEYIRSSGKGYDGPTDMESATSEFNLGIRYIIKTEKSGVMFLGIGPSFSKASTEIIHEVDTFDEVTFRDEYENVSVVDDDTGYGIWISWGTYTTLKDLFNIGLGFKYTIAPVTILDIDTDAGGGHLYLKTGFHF